MQSASYKKLLFTLVNFLLQKKLATFIQGRSKLLGGFCLSGGAHRTGVAQLSNDREVCCSLIGQVCCGCAERRKTRCRAGSARHRHRLPEVENKEGRKLFASATWL
jgi:hypothetical protein